MVSIFEVNVLGERGLVSIYVSAGSFLDATEAVSKLLTEVGGWWCLKQVRTVGYSVESFRASFGKRDASKVDDDATR